MAETGRETRLKKKNHGNILNPTPAPQLSEPRNLGGQPWRTEEISLSSHPLLVGPVPFGLGEDYGVADQRRLWRLQRDLARAPRSLRLWSASQTVTPGLVSTEPSWPNFTWGRISTGVCLGPWSYLTLRKFNDSPEMSLVEGALILFKAIFRHPLALQARWTFPPLPTLSVLGQ